MKRYLDSASSNKYVQTVRLN